MADKFQLRNLSTVQLRVLIEKANKELGRRNTAKLDEARKAVEKIAREAGIDISELIPQKLKRVASAPKPATQKGTKGRRRVKRALYCNPENPSQTWSGHGRRPQWVLDHLAKDGSLDDLKIGAQSEPPAEEQPAQGQGQEQDAPKNEEGDAGAPAES